MKLLLISPKMDDIENKILIQSTSKKKKSPLLGLPYLAAVTPDDIEVRIIDEVNGTCTDPMLEEADMIGITGMTMHANRMYHLADHYRAKNIPVVLGGIHVTYMPEEALLHADSIVVGEGEEVWGKLLYDFKQGALQKVYKSEDPISIENLPFPKLNLLDGPSYHHPEGSLNSVMASRGCPHDCDFCCVSKMFGRKVRIRSIDHVIEEINCLKKDFVFFNDDNIIGNPAYAKALFTALKPLDLSWGGQASIKLAENEELLHLAKESGCKTIFIGIESLNTKNIESVNKHRINKVNNYKESLLRIQEQGIKIIGSFIIGLDNDNEESFDQLFEFIEDTELEHPVINILTPFPGTRLYERMKSENRIIDKDWTHYDFGHVVFKPNRLTPERLQEEYVGLLGRINRYLFRRTMSKLYK